MKLQIYDDSDQLEYIDCTLYHDIKGNIYFYVNSRYLLLTIGENNIPEWIEIFNFENSLDNSCVKYSKIKNTNEKGSLRKKVINSLKDKETESRDTIEDDSLTRAPSNYYPENKLYTTNDDLIDDDESDIDEIGTFSFSKFDESDSLIFLDKYLDSLSTYETFVINLNTSYVLATSTVNAQSEYRVSIYTDEKQIITKISVNVIGSCIIEYDVYALINEININNITGHKENNNMIDII